MKIVPAIFIRFAHFIFPPPHPSLKETLPRGVVSSPKVFPGKDFTTHFRFFGRYEPKHFTEISVKFVRRKCRRRTRPRRVWMAPRRHHSATRNEHARVSKEEGNPVRAERARAHQRRLHGVPKSPCSARRGGGHQPGLVGPPPGTTCRRPSLHHGAAGRKRDSRKCWP